MAFFIRILFATALVYTVKAGVLTGHHDGGLSSGLSAPSGSYGPPAPVYGAPALSSGHDFSHGSELHGGHLEDHSHGGLHGGHLEDHSHGGLLAGGQLEHPGGPYPAAVPGSSYTEGGINLSSNLPATSGGLNAGTALGPPRVIGTTVSVGRPVASATRYELQSVVQNVIRRVPVEVTRHIQVAVPQPVPVPVRQEVKVPVPQPYPVHVDVVKHVPYPVYKTEHVEVERPVPVEVIKKVPVEVIKKIPIPVERPYEVIKKVPVPVEKHVHVPYPVWKPYPIHIIKHVTHYEKKKKCCW